MSYKMSLLKFSVPVFYSMFSGCSTSYEGKALNAVYHSRTDELVKKYTPGPKEKDFPGRQDLFSAGSAKERNQKINDLVYLIDRNYDNWEKRLYDKKAFSDFFGSAAVIGLNAAGSITGGTEVKSILHAISGGIESTKIGFDKDVLQNQNMLAIIAKMRALRAEKLNTLLRGMQQDIDTYSMEAALVDLGDYYNAGSFTAALQDITAKAGIQKSTNDAENQQLKTLKGHFSYTDDSVTLRNFWKPNGTVNAENAVAFKKWLDANEKGVDIATFIYSNQFAVERNKAVLALVNSGGKTKTPSKPVKKSTQYPSSATTTSNPIVRIGNLPPLPESSTTALRSYWKPGGAVDPEHAAKFQAWLNSNEDHIDIATFIDNSKYESDHQKALSALLKQ